MPRRGYILIADLVGYTIFLTKSELEHAQAILETFFEALLDEIKEPLILSNFQGDALLVHVPDDGVPHGQVLLEAIERLYCAFAATKAELQRDTSCSCNACRNTAQLDLKFILHHGEYVLQTIGGRQELQGADVIRAHRLLKNRATAITGVKAYALVTEAAASAMRVPEFFAELPEHVETNPELGDTAVAIYDLHPVWERQSLARRVVVAPDEPLAFAPMEADLPVPSALAWAYVTDVRYQQRWQQGFDGITMSGLQQGRVGPGSIQHCTHGRLVTRNKIVDWRPFEYVTYQIAWPFGATVRQMVELTPSPTGGTHVSIRCAAPEGASGLSTALTRALIKLRAGRIERDRRLGKQALERLAAGDTNRTTRAEPARLSRADISTAAAAVLAEV
jgi:class 3 adenylate cyclase